MKTYVLDASALFIFLQKKPGAARVNDLLKQALREHARVLMSAVNYAEVYGKIAREHGVDRAQVTMNAVVSLPFDVVDASLGRCIHAADVKNQYKLHYVDGFAVALAIEHKATLVTSDSDFRKLGHSFSLLWLKS
jgi:PIN domain nuclease of toxin-antitoxin system